MECGFAAFFRWPRGLVRHDVSPRAIIRVDDYLPDEPVVNLSAFEGIGEISGAATIG
jgi:hypothetical protein